MALSQTYRMTHQRRIILEELKKVSSHPTADGVYEMVRLRLPRISLGTVYRNLEILSGCGMIQKLEMGGAQRRFDGNAKNHYHVRCIRCDRLKDVPIEPITAIGDALSGNIDYEIIGHRLEFIGICPQCRKEGQNFNKDVHEMDRKEK